MGSHFLNKYFPYFIRLCMTKFCSAFLDMGERGRVREREREQERERERRRESGRERGEGGRTLLLLDSTVVSQ